MGKNILPNKQIRNIEISCIRSIEYSNKIRNPLYGTMKVDKFGQIWFIGDEIGQGAFGTAYQTFDYKQNKIMVMKIGVEDNEKQFYRELEKLIIDKQVDQWMEDKNLFHFPIGRWYSEGEDFIIFQKYGKNLNDIFTNPDINNVICLNYAIQILYAIEFLHHFRFSHGDIKASNIVRDIDQPDLIYLIDFGITDYLSNSTTPDSSVNGTLIYCPRDVHFGFRTRRGDLESLLYNLIDWLSYNEEITHLKLPWKNFMENSENCLQNIQSSKIVYMDDHKDFICKIGFQNVPWIKDFEKLFDV